MATWAVRVFVAEVVFRAGHEEWTLKVPRRFSNKRDVLNGGSLVRLWFCE